MLRQSSSILAALALVGFAASPHGDLPNRDMTPGAVDPRVISANIDETICLSGYTKSVRPPSHWTSALKHRQLEATGLGDHMRDYEEDHLIPLELGGAPKDPRNLWPEHWKSPWGARTKDRLENALHKLVCNHELSLGAAQQAFTVDWRESYRAYFRTGGDDQ